MTETCRCPECGEALRQETAVGPNLERHVAGRRDIFNCGYCGAILANRWAPLNAVRADEGDIALAQPSRREITLAIHRWIRSFGGMHERTFDELRAGLRDMGFEA